MKQKLLTSSKEADISTLSWRTGYVVLLIRAEEVVIIPTCLICTDTEHITEMLVKSRSAVHAVVTPSVSWTFQSTVDNVCGPAQAILAASIRIGTAHGLASREDIVGGWLAPLTGEARASREPKPKRGGPSKSRV